MATNKPLVSSYWVIEELKPFQLPGAVARNQSSRVPAITSSASPVPHLRPENGRPYPAAEPASRELWRVVEGLYFTGEQLPPVVGPKATQVNLFQASQSAPTTTSNVSGISATGVSTVQGVAPGTGSTYEKQEAPCPRQSHKEEAEMANEEYYRLKPAYLSEETWRKLPDDIKKCYGMVDKERSINEIKGVPTGEEEPMVVEPVEACVFVRNGKLVHALNVPVDIADRRKRIAPYPFFAGKVFGPQESHSECPPAPDYMLPDQCDVLGSGGPDQREEPASRQEQRDETPCPGSGTVERADSTSGTTLADVKSEENSVDASLVSKNMFDFLTSGKSTVTGAPEGVFTLKALPKGLHFGPYHGVKVDCIENGGCTWPVRRCAEFFVVDGRQQERNHWMNSVNYSPSKRRQNLVAVLFNGDIYYRTLRDVGPGEELLVGYSTSFAESLLGNPRGRGALKEEDVNIVPLHSLFLACEKCGDLFTTQYNLEMHTRRKHWSSMHGIRRCAYCTYTSSRKADVIRHERTHVEKRNSVCHLCQKSFTKPDHLKVHMMTHSGDKPYECGHCGKRFRQRGHARRHEEVIHFRRYPLHCPQCGAGAEDVTKLRRHTCKPLATTEGKEGVKRGRGRPRLRADGSAPKVRPRNTTESTPLKGRVKRGRGRPRKAVAQDASTSRSQKPTELALPQQGLKPRRGRPGTEAAQDASMM